MHLSYLTKLAITILFGVAVPTSAARIYQHPLSEDSSIKPTRVSVEFGSDCGTPSSQDPVCTEDVGDVGGMQFVVRVIDADDPAITLCVEPLVAMEPAVVSPPDIIFGSSSYQILSGSISPAELPDSSAFSIIGRYGGAAEFIQSGTACVEFFPPGQVLDVSASVQFDAATAIGGPAACATEPVISDNSHLGWGKKDIEPCVISFGVTNGLSRPANFGAIQVDFGNQYYLVIGGNRFNLQTTDDGPVLLSEDPKKIVKNSKTIQPGTNGVLKYTHSPGIDLGKGCWRTSDGSANGTYTSVGFLVNYQSFVMQDWDADGITTMQVPFGGPSSVYNWLLSAQADLVNGTWTLNEKVTRLKQPTVLSEALAYGAFWRGWAQNPAGITGQLADDGCYVLDTNPTL